MTSRIFKNAPTTKKKQSPTVSDTLRNEFNGGIIILEPEIQPAFSFAAASRQEPMQYWPQVVCDRDRRWRLRKVNFFL
jgi:hypothetical protein